MGGRDGIRDLERLATEHRGELGVDDLHHLLAGIERLAGGDADGLLADAGDDVADDADVHVGLEQGRADLFQDLVDVGFGEPTLAADLLDDAFEACGQRIEHALRRLPEATYAEADDRGDDSRLGGDVRPVGDRGRP